MQALEGAFGLLLEEVWVSPVERKEVTCLHPEDLPHGSLYWAEGIKGGSGKPQPTEAQAQEDSCCLPEAGQGLEQGQAGRGNILSGKWEEGRRNRRGGKSQTRKLLHHLLPTQTESPADRDL